MHWTALSPKSKGKRRSWLNSPAYPKPLPDNAGAFLCTLSLACVHQCFFAGLSALLSCGSDWPTNPSAERLSQAVFDTLYLLPATDTDTAHWHICSAIWPIPFRYSSFCCPRSPCLHLPGMHPHKRHWADSLLKWMLPMAHKSRCRWLLVTGSHISTTRKDHFNWGVMSLAYRPSRVAAVNDYRLQEHKRPTGAVRAALLKIALQELVHTVGNDHCQQPHCLMQAVEGRDKTSQLSDFCNACQKRLF